MLSALYGVLNTLVSVLYTHLDGLDGAVVRQLPGRDRVSSTPLSVLSTIRVW